MSYFGPERKEGKNVLIVIVIVVFLKKIGKESACNAGDLGLIPWRRIWLPTPIFLLGKSHAQRSLVGYSPWCRKSLTELSV